MSYLSRDQIEDVSRRFGSPERVQASFEITSPEFEMLRSSRRHERSHDVTLFIFRDGQRREFVGISKHMFPPGIYRAPSGAVHPGEDFVTGSLREATEETGLQVSLDRFILAIEVLFTCEGDSEPWTSYVFTAMRQAGELAPIDLDEIKEARWLTFEELQGSIREAMLATGAGLFRYRVFLHDAVFAAIAGDADVAGSEVAR